MVHLDNMDNMDKKEALDTISPIEVSREQPGLELAPSHAPARDYEDPGIEVATSTQPMLAAEHSGLEVAQPMLGPQKPTDGQVVERWRNLDTYDLETGRIKREEEDPGCFGWRNWSYGTRKRVAGAMVSLTISAILAVVIAIIRHSNSQNSSGSGQ